MAPEDSAAETPLPSARTLMEQVEKERQTSARLLESFAAKLGLVASRGSRSARVKLPLSEMATGIDNMVRMRPGSSFLFAVVAGYLVGRAIRSTQRRKA
jgi:hypothetical protein